MLRGEPLSQVGEPSHAEHAVAGDSGAAAAASCAAAGDSGASV